MAYQLNQESSPAGRISEAALNSEGIRSDAESLRKVIGLAAELQGQDQGSFSLEEMERIGAELGLEPRYVRLAHARIHRKKGASRLADIWNRQWGAIVAVWWSAGWAVPLTAPVLLPHGSHGGLQGAGFLVGMAIYIGGGILISSNPPAGVRGSSKEPSQPAGSAASSESQ